MSQFILIIPQAKPEQTMVIQNLFLEGRANWWHWSSDVWLLIIENENLAVEEFKDEIRRALPAAHFIVFKVDSPSKVSGWGPDEWVLWFKQFWK